MEVEEGNKKPFHPHITCSLQRPFYELRTLCQRAISSIGLCHATKHRPLLCCRLVEIEVPFYARLMKNIQNSMCLYQLLSGKKDQCENLRYHFPLVVFDIDLTVYIEYFRDLLMTTMTSFFYLIYYTTYLFPLLLSLLQLELLHNT